jgi:hypothetical protein
MTISIKRQDSNILLPSDASQEKINYLFHFNQGSGQFYDEKFESQNASKICDFSRNTITVIEKSKSSRRNPKQSVHKSMKMTKLSRKQSLFNLILYFLLKVRTLLIQIRMKLLLSMLTPQIETQRLKFPLFPIKPKEDNLKKPLIFDFSAR